MESVQIVGYEPIAGALLAARDGEIEQRSLDPGTELSYTLGNRHCAGVLSDEEHTPCENEGTPYCEIHTWNWVCARCTGTCLKDEMDCYEEHAVYLAGFAPTTFKVGVTRAARLTTRLREQGADRGAHIHTVSNGRIAREIEHEIAEEITDRVRVPTKIAGLEQELLTTEWNKLLREYPPIETFELEYDLRLNEPPVPETIATGTVAGTKGRVLVLERSEGTYAVDMRDLVGYEITEEESDRPVQSSLSVF